eukprot:15338892-Ditylum_brightwellii.AAC.1
MAAITHNNTGLPTIQSSQLVLPQWIGDTKKVTLKLDGKWHIGFLQLDQGSQKFKYSISKSTINLPNFALTYKSLLHQQLILPGWHNNIIPAATAAHVSTSGLMCNHPDSLIKRP